MTLPKYKDLQEITTIVAIEKEILVLTKNLFDFRIKRATNQNIKPHLFLHTKRRLAQLKFKKHYFTLQLKNEKTILTKNN